MKRKHQDGPTLNGMPREAAKSLSLEIPETWQYKLSLFGSGVTKLQFSTDDKVDCPTLVFLWLSSRKPRDWVVSVTSPTARMVAEGCFGHSALARPGDCAVLSFRQTTDMSSPQFLGHSLSELLISQILANNLFLPALTFCPPLLLPLLLSKPVD